MRRRFPVGSVRWRITLTVTVVFGLALTLASVVFVQRVRGNLVDGVQAGDRVALERLATMVRAGEQLPTVLPASPDRPASQLQVVGPDGVVAATSGLADRPPLVNPPGRPPGPNAGPGQMPRPGQGPSGQIPPPPNGGAQPDPVPPGPNGQAPNGPRPPNGQGPNGQGPNGQAPSGQAPSGQGPRPGPAAGGAEAPSSTGAVARAPAGVPPSGREGQDYALTSVPVGSASGDLSLVAVSSLDDVRQSVDALVQGLWVGIPVLVLLIAVAAWVMTGQALRPVAAITSRAEAITASTLHERVPEPRSRDEVAHLARTVNAMLDRLEWSATRQRQFVSDASHELRTPVSSIRTEMEVALLAPESTDWPEAARSVLAEDARLERIVGDLLTLARFDEQPAVDHAGDVDLDAVVEAEVGRARRLPVTVDLVPARVQGRVDELSRMVGHLLDNATRHARSAVAVALRPSITGGGRPQILLTVDDDGPGVAVDQRLTVFERFGRLDDGRARDSGGAGLGLAVVRRVAERHGGSVAVTDSALGGARFEVRLPSS